MEINARRYINSFFSGSHSSSHRDCLIDVDVVREYQAGDRKLDSRSSLKASKTMARVFNPERSMTIFLIVDLSASQTNKLDAVMTVCLYFSYLASIINNKIGFILFSDEVLEVIEPTYDGKYIGVILERYYHQDLKNNTNLESGLNKTLNLHLSNAFFVLVSDFCYNISENSIKLLRNLSLSNQCYSSSLVLVNEEEWSFDKYPFMLDFTDAESNERVSFDFSQGFEVGNLYEDITLKLRQACSEPVVLYVNQENYLMPLVRNLIRG